MFLKSLEIRGFKSFADKTQLKFKEGITAVVGPNGSGKSNISDSVRWVLGEQSVKTLRGGKMEDVIFAGTQFRRPVGLAQVSITLDNSDNSLDTDYSEVTVTRRIFRSGETEYLINNQKCRLKDINNLFMDTGIGKEGYSLIGQGKIESILSGRTEDRRALLEEAAGIVKFKSRKEEAERRLSNTENNLIRIRDIISTYEERIGPLKIEREKALEYKDLAEKLRVKEISILVDSIKRIKNELSLTTQDIIQRKGNIENKKGELCKNKESFLCLEKTIEELEKKNNDERNEYYNKKEGLSQELRDVEIFNERIKNLEEIIKKDTEEIRKLEVSLEKYAMAKNDSLMELQEKIKEQLQKENDIKKAEDEIYNLSKEIKYLEEKVERYKDEEFDLLSKISEVSNNLSALNKEISSKEQMSLNGESDLRSIAVNISNNLAAIEELNKKNDEAKKIKDIIENGIDENKKRLSNLNRLLVQKEGVISEVSKHISILEGKFTTLKDLEEGYEGYQLSVKRLMERVGDGRISYGKNPKVLGEVFTVSKEFETAIEISLGGSISNIITKDESTAKLLIEYLKKNTLGRATFLPLNIIKGNRLNVSNEINNIPGFLGLASDLLSFDAEFKEVIDYVLGKTIIAKDMNSALKISQVGNYRLKIVTLNGEVISPGGALTGGSIYKRNNSSILGRRRELQEVERDISKSKKIYSLEYSNLNKIKEEIRDIDEENLNKSDKLHEKIIDITKFEGEAKALENEGAKLRTAFEILKKEISLNNENLKLLRLEIKNEEQILNKLRDDNVVNKNDASNILVLLMENREKFNRIKDDFMQMKIYKAKLDEIVYSRELEVKRKEREEQEISDKILGIQAEKEEKKNAMNSLKDKVEHRIKLIEKINSRLGELETIFKSDEAKRITLKDKLKIKDGEISESIEVVRNLEVELNKKEVIYAKIESENEGYYRKLNEELDLTLAEAIEIALDIEDVSVTKEEILKIKNQITLLGMVNLASIAEYEDITEKYEFMSLQEEDLNKSKEELLTVINEMTTKMQDLFRKNFETLNKNFNETFKDLFKGGDAQLILGEGDELTSNIEINVQPPGKKLQNINLMSGGEKVLSAIALLFAILKMKPTPFCILDEIEAALDDANVYRYAEFLRRFSENIQFIVITHRKGTMESSDIMYGVTMEEKGVSKLVSVDLSKNN